MSLETRIAELRARLQLAQGTATLLVVVANDDAVLDETRRLLLEILRATPMAIADLGVCRSDTGPARWLELIQGRSADAYCLMFTPSSPLATAAFARLLNAERELLRRLTGPVLLVVSRETERVLRVGAGDFFTWAAQVYAMADLAELQAIAPKLGAAQARVLPVVPQEEPVRFLHISDLHLRPKRGKRYDQDRVLRGLIEFLRRDRADFPLDLIFVTGDLAYSGKPEEYELVAQLLSALVAETGVPVERVFVVPGNHDVDREVGQWLLRTLPSDDASIEFFTESKNRAFHARKFGAYQESMRSLLGPSRPVGLGVGSDAVEIVEIRGSRLAITSLNSAWFAQGDDDEHKLWLGEPNILGALGRIAEEDAAFAVALLHHPLEDLHEHERQDVRRWFERGFDLMLRGHLHETRTTAIAGQRGGYVEVAAPAAYQGSQWTNGCFFGEIRTLARTVRLRPFTFSAGPDPWVLDTKVFPDDEKDGYCRTFSVPEKNRSRSLSRGQRRSTRASEVPSDEGVNSIALENAIRSEAGADRRRRSPVSITSASDFEQALVRAGRILLGARARLMGDRWLSENTAVRGIAIALHSLVDMSVTVNARMALGRVVDIVVGDNGERPLAIIEVKRLGQLLRRERYIEDALQQLEAYASKVSAQYYALVLDGGLAGGESEPRTSTMKTPGGRDVVVLYI